MYGRNKKEEETKQKMEVRRVMTGHPLLRR